MVAQGVLAFPVLPAQISVCEVQNWGYLLHFGSSKNQTLTRLSHSEAQRMAAPSTNIKEGQAELEL